MKVHVIGICGMGMSATATLLKKAGYAVTGSDVPESYGPPLDLLAHAGITPSLGYTPDNIPADVDLFVVGRNAKLTPEVNDEVRAAFGTGKPVYSFPEVLAQLTEGRHNVVVAGSYGKSTTTTLVAHILRHAGVDAGYFSGGEPSPGDEALPSAAEIGTPPYFILEGDEYPSAHDDPRAKFLHLNPRDLILTAVVHDHVNVYPTFEGYQEPFVELLASIPDDGLVVCSDESTAASLALASGKKIVPYGLREGIYRAANILYGERTSFTLIKDESPVVDLETELLGAHNIENIVGASAYVLERKLVTPEQLAAAVARFPGVRRRLDNLAPSSSVPVFEGFGSSYEKARSAMDALLLHFPARPLVVIFEPHTFGWRNRANLDWYDTVFLGAREVYIAPPETQGAGTHDQLSHEEIMLRARDAGVSVHAYDPDGVDALAETLDPAAVVLILTSGDLLGSLKPLARAIGTRFS